MENKMSDQPIVFNPSEAIEFGRTKLDAGTALQVHNHLLQLDLLPEEERAPFGSQQRTDESFARLAVQSFTLNRSDINRQNAQLSTGPRTVDGLLRSSLNAVKHGLTGKSHLVGSEEQSQFDSHLSAVTSIYQPVGEAETLVVAEIADARWRLGRVPRLEAALYAKGRMVFRDQFADVDLELQTDLVEIETHLHYEKALRNIHLQESRIRRTQLNLEAQLQTLQTERKSREQAEADTKAAQRKPATAQAAPVRSNHSSEDGFVFAKDPTATEAEPSVDRNIRIPPSRAPRHSR
jgi:hypothetical protein